MEKWKYLLFKNKYARPKLLYDYSNWISQKIHTENKLRVQKMYSGTSLLSGIVEEAPAQTVYTVDKL